MPSIFQNNVDHLKGNYESKAKLCINRANRYPKRNVKKVTYFEDENLKNDDFICKLPLLVPI